MLEQRQLTLKMKIAAAKAIADLAKEDVPDEVANAYPEKDLNMVLNI